MPKWIATRLEKFVHDFITLSGFGFIGFLILRTLALILELKDARSDVRFNHGDPY